MLEGRPSTGNSSQTPLGSSEAFTGVWEQNNYDHALVNVVADQAGTIYLDFGVRKTDSTFEVMFTRATEVYAGVPHYQAVVKGAGRWLRVRYQNGSAAQGNFVLYTAYGSNYLPSSASDDNEVLTTVTERERDVFAALQLTDVSASGYAGLIDLSDTTTWPHDRTGRIDITSTNFSIDRNSTATGFVRVGVITRVDETDADVAYVSGITFEKSDDRQIIRDRRYSPSQLKCGVVDGALTRILSDFTAENVTAINTGGTLTGPGGNTFTPAVGDIIVGYGRTAGSYNASVSVTYHGERGA